MFGEAGMPEIFISYTSQDRTKAEALAAFLEKRSCTVFWDRRIQPGRSFDQVIEEALCEAKAVIVIWSKASVVSDWVKVEAEDAAGRGVLLPAMIERVVLPLRFRYIQTADLSQWDFNSSAREISDLMKSLERCLGRTLPMKEADSCRMAVPREDQWNGIEGRWYDRHTVVATPMPSYLRAIAAHLLLGCGLFYVDRRLKRKWLYLLFALYALIDALSAHVLKLGLFGGSFGLYSFIVATTLYELSFIDVGVTCYLHRR